MSATPWFGAVGKFFGELPAEAAKTIGGGPPWTAQKMFDGRRIATPPPALHLKPLGLPPERGPGGLGQSSELSWGKSHRKNYLCAPDVLLGALEPVPDTLAEFFQIIYREEAVYTFAAAAAGTPKGEDLLRLRWQCHQHALIRTLNVTGTGTFPGGGRSRYTKSGTGQTWCNIYARDLVGALGGYIPSQWWEDPNSTASGARAYECSANDLANWLSEWGEVFGWARTPSSEDAQNKANAGNIVVCSAFNPKPNLDKAGLPVNVNNLFCSGHISVVIAEEQPGRPTGDARSRFYGEGKVLPLQSQAGDPNYLFGGIADEWWLGGMRPEPAGNFWWCRPNWKLGTCKVPKDAMVNPVA